MAVISKETEVIDKGINALTITNSSFVQNMYWREGAWHVRKGFGTLGEFDSSLTQLTPLQSLDATPEGIQKHLGSHLMRTNFGHDQIISVFETLGYVTLVKGDKGARLNMYTVHIYDITTDEHWEELLTHSTGADKVTLPLRRGHYESQGTYSNPITKASRKSNPISFVENNDILLMANEELGVLYYKPTSFRGNRTKAINTLDTVSIYSDSCLINRLVLSPNLSYSAQYDYLDFFPQPIKSVASINGRIIYLSHDSIYFSDNNNKIQSIVIDNQLLIPSQYPLTAAKEINGNLLIFTEKETFVFQPSQTFLPIQGRLTKISESVGCSNAGVITKFHNTVLWADANGVHTNGGDLSILTISDGLKNFWDSFLTNPVSHYLTESGEASATAPQPRIQTSYDPSFASICYYDALKITLLTIPNERITLCLSENKQWSLWSWDSPAYFETEGLEDVPKVGVREFMSCAQLVATNTDLYAIGLDDTNRISFDYQRSWNAITEEYDLDAKRRQRFRSYYITHYGRGGAIDRSAEYEDYRYGIGEWEKQDLTGLIPAEGDLNVNLTWDLYFGEPIRIAPGYEIDGQAMATASVLVPVYAKMPQSVYDPVAATWIDYDFWEYPPTTMQIQFEWDGSNWEPVNTANKVNLIFPTPMERMGAGMGFGNTGFTMTFTSSAMILQNLIHIGWNQSDAEVVGGVSGYSMRHFPNQLNIALGNQTSTDASALPLLKDKKQLLFYIPFKSTTQDTTSKMGIHNVEGFMFYDNFNDVTPIAGTNYINAQPWVFNQSMFAYPDINIYQKSQGVTWAYSSAPVGIDDPNRYKARGIWAQVKSKGTADIEISNGWGSTPSKLKPRTYNTVVSSDNRQWNSQVVDYAETKGIDHSTLLPAGEQNSIRTKIRNTNSVMGYKTYNNDDNVWGDKGTPDGTVLIDDKQFASINDSNSVRGDWFSWMFFGHMLNRAEELAIKSAKAAVRVLGGRRRKGQ